MFDNEVLDFILGETNPFNWDKESYKFNRTEKDMHPFSVYNTEKMITIVHNVLGIEKNDLKILIDSDKTGNSYIKIVGETVDSITKNKYTIDSTFYVDLTEVYIDRAKSNMKNGLLYITIPKKEKTVKTTKKYIEIN